MQCTLKLNAVPNCKVVLQKMDRTRIEFASQTEPGDTGDLGCHSLGLDNTLRQKVNNSKKKNWDYSREIGKEGTGVDK